MCPEGPTRVGSPDIQLPRSLENWQKYSRGGNGPTSAPSPLTIDGARPALTPIVVSRTRESGLRRFLAALATISAWREAGTGEHILMLSLAPNAADLRSVLEPFETPGGSGEIAFDLTIPIGQVPGMLRNTLPRDLTTGIWGVPCDHCEQPFEKGQAYVQIVHPARVPEGETPPLSGGAMRIVHFACIRSIDYYEKY